MTKYKRSILNAFDAVLIGITRMEYNNVLLVLTIGPTSP